MLKKFLPLNEYLVYIVYGEMIVDGKKIANNFKSNIAFVQSEDVLYKDLTVRETLYFTAKMVCYECLYMSIIILQSHLTISPTVLNFL